MTPGVCNQIVFSNSWPQDWRQVGRNHRRCHRQLREDGDGLNSTPGTPQVSFVIPPQLQRLRTLMNGFINASITCLVELFFSPLLPLKTFELSVQIICLS